MCWWCLCKLTIFLTPSCGCVGGEWCGCVGGDWCGCVGGDICGNIVATVVIVVGDSCVGLGALPCHYPLLLGRLHRPESPFSLLSFRQFSARFLELSFRNRFTQTHVCGPFHMKMFMFQLCSL